VNIDRSIVVIPDAMISHHYNVAPNAKPVFSCAAKFMHAQAIVSHIPFAMRHICEILNREATIDVNAGIFSHYSMVPCATPVVAGFRQSCALSDIRDSYSVCYASYMKDVEAGHYY
jgi:hypothetical protein